MSLRGQWIFDDRGNFVAVDSYALRSMLPSLQYNGDLARDLARNLGFIAISPRGAWTQIRLRPQVVSDVAFANLMYWLADNQPSHIVIDAMDGSTVAPIFSETKGALAHLIELFSEKSGGRVRKEAALSIAKLPSGCNLRGLLAVWADGGQRDIEQLLRYSKKNLLSRHFVIKAAGGDLIFDSIGEGVKVPKREWQNEALGRSITAQADTDYWSWVAARQQMVLVSGEPFVSDVQADIYWPDSGWVTRDYRRIILPCASKDGTARLFIASSNRSGTAIDRLAG